ncbi:MAG: zinc-ribbon domain-containing protein [Gammaproteobacteria bacterium]
MKKCPACGHENPLDATQCPKCGRYYSKIIELLDQAAAEEEAQSFRGQCRRIFQADNIKLALKAELTRWWAGLGGRAKFTLFVIFVFVFALVASVL